MQRNEVRRSWGFGQFGASPRATAKRRVSLAKALPVGLGLAALALPVASPALAASGDWVVDAAGNWSDPANWSSNPTVPDGAGETANLGFNISANRTVTIDGTSRTLGSLTIGDPGTTYAVYTLAAGAGLGLTLNNNGNGATIAKTTTGNNVQDVITAPLTLADNLAVNISEATVPTVSTNLQFTGVITETGGARNINKTGVGIVRLDGASTFTGGVTVSQGELQVGGNATVTSGTITNGPLGTGTLTMAGGTTISARATSRTVPNPLNVTGNVTLNGGFGGGNKLTLSGNVDLGGATRTITVGSTTIATTGSTEISGVVSNGGITKAGPRPLTLSAANTYAGGTTIANAGGTLAITNGNALGTGQVNIATGGTNEVARLQLSGDITVPNTIRMAGATATNQPRIENLSGNNTLAGPINFYTTGGAYNPILSTAGTLTMNGNMTVTSPTGTRGFVFYGAGNVVAKGSITNGTANVLNLTKNDAGTLTLTPAAPSTYNGGTTVNAGTLIAGADSALGTGDVSVLGTSQLTLTGGTANNYVADLATLNLASTAFVNLNYAGTDLVNRLVVDGVDLGPGVYSAATNPFLTGTGTLTVAVPEPTSAGLLAAGAIGLLARRRRRRCR